MKKHKKHKKTVKTLLTAAVLLIAVFMTGCTKVSEASNKDAILGTNFSDEEFAKLSALQFDGYEEMTVSEFQNKIWELTDTNEYRGLLEKFSRDTNLYEQKDSDALASFLFYTLVPLTAEKWQTRDFGGSIATELGESFQVVSPICSFWLLARGWIISGAVFWVTAKSNLFCMVLKNV